MTALPLDEIDLSDMRFWARPLHERETAFAALRALDRPRFFAEPDFSHIGFPAGPGYYALVKHADVAGATRNPQVFSSAKGVANIFDPPEEFLEYFGSMIQMDDPRHARLRRIVSRAFTPRMIQKIDDDIDRAAAEIIDGILAADRSGDFVTEVAARLPLKIICAMMGIPESRYQEVFDRSNTILGAFDTEYVPDLESAAAAILGAGQDLQRLVQELGERRAERPRDDLISVLVNAEAGSGGGSEQVGERLTLQELGSFFILLVVAGNETTRNAIAHGLKLLTLNPEQKARWMSDFERYAPTAVEEIVRYASPVVFMRRTVTRDHEMNGQRYKEGDKVLMYYWSANRDDSVFADPYRFDIARSPNPHLGFGAAGPHYCLGAHLARREITVMFRELLRRVPDIRSTAPPERLFSSFINGIKHLPYEF